MNEELARRAVACPRWRWMEGMLARKRSGYHLQIVAVDEEALPRIYVIDRDILRDFEASEIVSDDWRDALPWLDHPATKGCLLALVREAHASPQSAEYVGDSDPVNPWRWGAFRGATEEAALVAALERAP